VSKEGYGAVITLFEASRVDISRDYPDIYDAMDDVVDIQCVSFDHFTEVTSILPPCVSESDYINKTTEIPNVLVKRLSPQPCASKSIRTNPGLT
jgi:hypothetical protein